MFHVLICGSRTFTDRALFFQKMDAILAQRKPEDIVIIHGCAAGADTMAGDYARVRQIAVKEFPADWSTGKWAGFVRNAGMVAMAQAVVGFHDGVSRGTAHTLGLARTKGIPVRVVRFVR